MSQTIDPNAIVNAALAEASAPKAPRKSALERKVRPGSERAMPESLKLASQRVKSAKAQRWEDARAATGYDPEKSPIKGKTTIEILNAAVDLRKEGKEAEGWALVEELRLREATKVIALRQED